ncbi:uncharacterized protein BO97DRAFT_178324 [Aspergillus homomorphus CBS 101889]|uniref:Uncharacterized protein n=1 Tax=Aspergillus homomorphus (strain CBS 101889) TaxID=1450537 RepID=A0A395ICS7_ASPHC|nr:hypothetical protein BO97DRAFT_178324 [Aspergillus homomorphus CBS 101889]RAL15974.1 hypothetical protein BO97DRAFT_178324 [Aspergillus homomorphus CBS 101889]
MVKLLYRPSPVVIEDSLFSLLWVCALGKSLERRSDWVILTFFSPVYFVVSASAGPDFSCFVQCQPTAITNYNTGAS